ncbi:MAG: hypothetical protein AAB250_14420 [Bdellovibrionota bacterium]
MRPGREIDARIAKEVFGFKVWPQGKILFENAPLGDRPLRKYSKEMEWAMEVAKHMHVALLPIAGGEWFAFVGPVDKPGWESPTAMLEFLGTGQFNDCGASVNAEPAVAICEAALKAAEKRKQAAEQPAAQVTDENLEEPTQQPPTLSVVDKSTTDSVH